MKQIGKLHGKRVFEHNDLESYFENYKELNFDYHIILNTGALMRGLFKVGETDGIRVEWLDGVGISFEGEYEVWKMEKREKEKEGEEDNVSLVSDEIANIIEEIRAMGEF